MPNASHFVAASALALTYDAVISLRNKRKYKRLQTANRNLSECLELTTKTLETIADSHHRCLKDLSLYKHQLTYVLHLLDENGVPVTEFDRIAMCTVPEKKS